MDYQIDKTVIQKVKDVLQFKGEISSLQLLKLLKDYRNKLHPDKFSEDKAKENATEKFKELGELVEELSIFIESEKLQSSAKDLALLEPLYDNVTLQSQLEEAQNKNEDLEKKIKSLKSQISDLDLELNKKQEFELEKENKALKKSYKPSKQSLASLGALFLLSSTFAIMSKIEQVSVILLKYSPLSEKVLNTAVFCLFVLMLILVLKQYIESKLISLKVSEVCSPKFSKEFWVYLQEKEEGDDDEKTDFTEEDVFSFISGRNSKFKSLLGYIGIKIFQIETIERLKNFFINTLLNKQLIRISYAQGFTKKKLEFLQPENLFL